MLRPCICEVTAPILEKPSDHETGEEETGLKAPRTHRKWRSAGLCFTLQAALLPNMRCPGISHSSMGNAALLARAFFRKASSALIYFFAEGNMVDLLNIVLYMSYLYLVLNWQPWGISFWSLSPCFPSHCHSRE